MDSSGSGDLNEDDGDAADSSDLENPDGLDEGTGVSTSVSESGCRHHTGGGALPLVFLTLLALPLVLRKAHRFVE